MMIFANEKHARLYAKSHGLHYLSAEDIAKGAATIGYGGYKVVDNNVVIANKIDLPKY